MNEQTLFAEALERTDSQERAAFLDQACQGDAQVRQRIDRLLAQHQHASAFLDEPARAFAPTMGESISERPGMMIGPYKLLQQIGEGGMGTVYMAEQSEPIQRKVALKVIKAGMDSKQVIARFEAERQALSMMDHVNIARVFDGGATETGRPYFVMELVHGVPITKYCDDNHLTPRERLELFVPVCQAIQHAHQKGIIHRDLKPSNVMVTLYDGKPVPKVIDFGVAKATEQKLTERTLFTQYGTMVGTLEYMSPEQAEMSALGVDTRSDIYSLGVLLYELLTGSTPLTQKRMKEAAYAEILRMIKEEEPPRPSTRLSDSGEALASISANRHTEPARLTKLVRGELDWIVMKCLEKDRDRRYETASGFAADVQRYLNDEPVQACPPSAGYRLRKFVRRNKRPVAAAAFVFLALVLGVLGMTFGLIRALEAEGMALRDRNKANAAEAEERQAKLQAVEAKQEAERNLAQAIKAADTFFTRVSENKLLDKPGLQPLRKELLQDALKHYQELLKQKKGDPKIKAEIAASYLRMVRMLTSLDEDDEAILAMQKALEIVEVLVRENPGNAEVAQRLAGVCKVERPLYRGWCGALSPFNTRLGLDTFLKACDIWTQLVRDHPTIPGLQNDLAAFWICVGDMHFYSRRNPECLRACRNAIALSNKLAGENAVPVEYRAADVVNRLRFSWFLETNENFDEAVQEARFVLKLQEKLVDEFPDNAMFQFLHAAALESLAEILHGTPDFQESHRFVNRAVEISEKLVARFPDHPSYLHQLAMIYLTKSNGLRKMGHEAEAEKSIQKAWTMAQKVFGDNPNRRSCQELLEHCSDTLEGYYLQAGRHKDADQVLLEQVNLKERFLDNLTNSPTDRLARAKFHQLRATVADKSADHLKEERDYRLAIKLYLGLVDEFPSNNKFQEPLEEMLHKANIFLASRNRHAESLALFQQALATFEGLAKREPSSDSILLKIGVFQLEIGHRHKELGQFAAAEQAYRRAIASHFQLIARFPKSPEYRTKANETHIALALFFDNTKRTEEAGTEFRKVLEAAEKTAGEFPDNLEVQAAFGHRQRDLAFHLIRMKRLEEAISCFQRSVVILEKAASIKSPSEESYLLLAGDNHHQMGALQRHMQHSREAERDFRAAVDSHTRLVSKFPENAHYREHLRNVHDALIGLLNERKSSQEVAAARRKLVDFYKKLSAERPGDPAFPAEIGHLLGDSGAISEARQSYEQALRILEKSRTSNDVIDQWFQLALGFKRLGQEDLARQVYDQGVARQKKFGLQSDQNDKLRRQAEELLGLKVKKNDEKK